MAEFSIDPSELAGLVGTAAAPRIFDVRRLQASQQSNRLLPAATWRDHLAAADWGRQLDPGRPVVVYCVSGHHVSQLAAAALRTIGIDARYLAGGIEAWTARGCVTRLKSEVCRAEGARSHWVTRTRPKIDRIACPWLIRRFIDPDAVFYFVTPDEVLAAAQALGGISYDIEGAAFTHVGENCTFDTLLEHFGLVDRSLDELALIVRGADTAKLDLAPECAGLLAVSLGNSALAGADDHVALALGFPVYDALLAWLRSARDETHNWPRTAAP